MDEIQKQLKILTKDIHELKFFTSHLVKNLTFVSDFCNSLLSVLVERDLLTEEEVLDLMDIDRHDIKPPSDIQELIDFIKKYNLKDYFDEDGKPIARS